MNHASNLVSTWMKKLPKNRNPLEAENQQQSLLLLATTASVTLALYWWQQTRRQQHHRQQTENLLEGDKTIASENAKLVDSQLWTLFEEHAFRIRTENIQSKLTDGDKLLLYGLYKQIVLGDAPEQFAPLQSWNIMVEQAKHDAWWRMRNMPIETAIHNYNTAAQYFLNESNNENVNAAESSSASSSAEQLLGAMSVSRPVIEDGTYFDTSTLPGQFLLAAGHNDVTKLQELLQQDATLTSHKDDAGQTALHLAADKGCNDAVKLLLARDAKLVHETDMDGISVLQAAVIAGQVETCRILLQAGANPDQEDNDGDTPRSCVEDQDDDDDDNNDEEDDGGAAMQKLFDSYPSKEAGPPISTITTGNTVQSSPLK